MQKYPLIVADLDRWAEYEPWYFGAVKSPSGMRLYAQNVKEQYEIRDTDWILNFLSKISEKRCQSLLAYIYKNRKRKEPKND